MALAAAHHPQYDKEAGWREKNIFLTGGNMSDARLAPMNIALVGTASEGENLYHEIVLMDGVNYIIELEAIDEAADLNLHITDEDGNIIYKDDSAESGASAWFKPGERAVYRLFVHCASGDTDYTLTIYEE